MRSERQTAADNASAAFRSFSGPPLALSPCPFRRSISMGVCNGAVCLKVASPLSFSLSLAFYIPLSFSRSCLSLYPSLSPSDSLMFPLCQPAALLLFSFIQSFSAVCQLFPSPSPSPPDLSSSLFFAPLHSFSLFGSLVLSISPLSVSLSLSVYLTSLT